MGLAVQLNAVCHNDTASIFVASLFVFTLVISTICAIYLIRNFCCKDKICASSWQGTKAEKRVKILCVIAEIQCTFCQIALIVMIYYLHNECVVAENPVPVEDEFSVDTKIVGFITVSSYQFSLTFVFLVFVCRVIAAFDGSIYSLSNKKIVLLSTLLVIQFSCNFGTGICFLIQLKYALIFMAASLVK